MPPAIEVLKVDNAAVRAEQIGKLARLKAERDSGAVEAALMRLSEAAQGSDNLLPPAIEAARAGATLGEMSAALERVFGRHVAEVPAPSGVYVREIQGNDAVERVVAMTAEFERNEGRRPSILVAKIGQDGHDRGQKVIASAFGDFGFDVEVGPLFATPEEAASQAVDERRTHRRRLIACRRPPDPCSGSAEGARGGRPRRHRHRGRRRRPAAGLRGAEGGGVSAIFPPGTVAAEAAVALLDELNRVSATRSGAQRNSGYSAACSGSGSRCSALARASVLIFACRFCFAIASAPPRVW